MRDNWLPSAEKDMLEFFFIEEKTWPIALLVLPAGKYDCVYPFFSLLIDLSCNRYGPLRLT